jgi:uncharacterized membrane protein (UPF0136 family)
MPPIFKVFASVTVWILFVFGFISLIGGFVRMFQSGSSLSLVSFYLGFGVASLTLAAVVARIRQTMGE